MPCLKPRKLRRDKDGVASTVGTIMALLVVLTFLSLLVNQYVPVWGKETEAAHQSTVFGQFGSFKSSVDTQILSAQVAATSGSTYIPTETYTAVQLGTPGLPVFSGPSIGQLTGSGDQAPWTIQFQYAIESSVYTVNQTSAGNVVLEVRNRYHVPFSLIYEGGGILMSQSAGEAVRVDPQFAILNATNGIEVALTMVNIIGSGNVADSGTEGIHSKLLVLDIQEFTALQSSLWINHTTRYGNAWFQHLNNTLSLTFAVLDSDFGGPGYQYFESPAGQTVTTPYYTLSRAESGQTHNISLEIVHNPPTRPIAKVSVNYAYLSIAVGRRGSTLEV